MSRIRVLIADDHEVVREGLAHVVAQAPDMRVAALAADGKQALSAALEHEPHVAVVDMRMPGLGGIAAITQLRQKNKTAAQEQYNRLLELDPELAGKLKLEIDKS